MGEKLQWERIFLFFFSFFHPLPPLKRGDGGRQPSPPLREGVGGGGYWVWVVWWRLLEEEFLGGGAEGCEDAEEVGAAGVGGEVEGEGEGCGGSGG